MRQTITKFKDWLPVAEEFRWTEALFLRLLGLIYVFSFASFWPQIVGLVGSHGISPASQLLAYFRSQGVHNIYFQIPTLFWFGVSDRALIACCVAGCVSGLFMFSGFLTRPAAIVSWLLYLSLVNIGEPFSAFQWDALLLESGLLAVFAGAPLLRLAYRFLLFRLMFESGLVKLTSHDPNWRNFHALRFHFLTQPLPNPIAYHAYRLPTSILDFLTGATLAIELITPFLLFGPRLVRYIAASLLIVLQVVILLTGNYAFFNLLTLALCLWAFDDVIFSPLARVLRRSLTLQQARLKLVSSLLLGCLILLGASEVIDMIVPVFAAPVAKVLSVVGPFQVANTYGLFAVMTTKRPEIVLQGSNDQVIWKDYNFRFKPGELHRGLPFVAPYQPRLDWQMWFAALGSYDQNTWVGGLMYRLMNGEPSVLGLIEAPPFATPPKYMRAMLYNYQFTSPDERARTGAVWQRQVIGSWWGPVALKQ